MTAPTSPKPPMPADPNDLRTALTKLAVPMYYDATPGAYPVTAVPMSHLLSVLAARPAPAPVSDTRREGVEAGAEAAWLASQEVNGFAENSWAEVSEPQRESWRHIARAVLVVLPAPPAVDEAAVRERIAQDIARAVGEGTASDIARATR